MTTTADSPQDGGWRAIETAPKDGEPRLLYWPAIDQNGMKQCAHIGIREDNGGPFRHPTHWQPLPAPPTPESTS